MGSPPRTINNIIFDLSEVLLTGIKDTGIALGEKHKLENAISHKVGWTHIKTPLLIPLVEEFLNGNVSEDEYIKGVLEQYPQLGTEDWLKQHIRENFKEVEGTRNIISELKGLKYTMALLSVHAKEWIDYCEQKFDFHKLFDVRVYSYETKVSKPHPLSFKKVLEELNAGPENCLFIDDSEINVKAAEVMSIKSILFIDAQKLRDDLGKLLPDFTI